MNPPALHVIRQIYRRFQRVQNLVGGVQRGINPVHLANQPGGFEALQDAARAGDGHFEDFSRASHRGEERMILFGGIESNCRTK